MAGSSYGPADVIPSGEGRVQCPRQDSNLRFRLRRAALYPLSYGGPRPQSSNGPSCIPGRRRRLAMLGAWPTASSWSTTTP